MKVKLKNGNKKLINSVHLCSECHVSMVRESNEFLCPKCGMVQDIIDGSD